MNIEFRLHNPKILDEAAHLALDLLSYCAPNSCNLSHHGNLEGTKGQLDQGMETVHLHL